MGGVKSKLIKRTAKELHSKLNGVSTEFSDNKKILGNRMPSKKLRNKIAGYLGRLEKQKKAHALKINS